MALYCGMAPHAAVEMLRLARDAPCSTNMIEQAHGLSATSMGYHSSHSELTLQARMLIHQARAAFAKPMRSEVERLRGRIDHLDQKMTKRFRGCDLAVSTVQETFRASGVPTIGKGAMTRVFRQRSAWLRKMPTADKLH